MTKTMLKKYANLIAELGVNIQQGQEVIIAAELDQPQFIKILVEECYKRGAKKVQVEWSYQPLDITHTKHKTVETMSSFEKWEVEKLKWREKELPAMIYILSQDPDGLRGIDQEKIKIVNASRYKVLKPYRDAMENKYQWCIAAAPSVAWAKKLFPKMGKGQAVEKLWQLILSCSHINENPIDEWKKLERDLKNKCLTLNSYNFCKLKYRSDNGTDFCVGLIENSQFLGGAEKTLSGIVFNPNIPSEEVFVSPKKGEAEGIVYSTKPLSYKGELIENFSIRFEKGKAVEVKAEKNEALLKKMISMDEGASYLGECALISQNSPINRSGVLFYETLFDENASCHLALGSGYSNTIKDFEKCTLEECRKMGINESMIHVDFMIGADDLSIIGVTADGKEIQIFKNGDWAI